MKHIRRERYIEFGNPGWMCSIENEFDLCPTRAAYPLSVSQEMQNKFIDLLTVLGSGYQEIATYHTKYETNSQCEARKVMDLG